METFPEIITFRITSRCNYNCNCCFGPKNVSELPLKKLKEIFMLLSKKGAKAIVLTGGEPLIREDIKEIIHSIKQCNMKIYLDTNGSLFFSHNKIIDENVDVLGVPIYSPEPEYKGTPKLEPVIKILEYYKNKDKKPVIRIGTVITQENSESIEEIGNLIKDYPINLWKIYEFLPQNVNAVNNKNKLEISKEKFNEIGKRIMNKFSEYFKISISNREKRNLAYFFINPDGKVFMPVDDGGICKERGIGDIFDREIIKKWRGVISEENYNKNIQDTFRLN